MGSFVHNLGLEGVNRTSMGSLSWAPKDCGYYAPVQWVFNEACSGYERMRALALTCSIYFFNNS